GADDDGDLALEGQQRGPRRPFDRLPRRGHGAAGLEEVGRLCGPLPALGRTGLIGHMDGNDLARTGGNTRSRHRTHTSFRLASPQIVYDTVPENKYSRTQRRCPDDTDTHDRTQKSWQHRSTPRPGWRSQRSSARASSGTTTSSTQRPQG